MLKDLSCSICGGNCTPLDVVDFNKTCAEAKGCFFRLSGVPVYYYLCSGCGFCFAPEFRNWGPKDYSEHIYNDDYIKVDPDFVEKRPKANASVLHKLLGGQKDGIQHLDYGGGNGMMSRLLKQMGWNSYSHDILNSNACDIGRFGPFNLITAYEVFEHVADVNDLMQRIKSLVTAKGLVLISTFLSDGHIFRNRRLDWWYASPRNGHISLFSKESLKRLTGKYGFTFISLSQNLHIFFSEKIPSWASHLINR